MFVVLLITGMAFIPQGQSLKCNKTACGIDDVCRSKEIQCEPEMTRCGVVRQTSIPKIPELSDALYRSCIKADTCKDASIGYATREDYYATQCCDKDMCNSELVPPPLNRNPAPNGQKCYVCDGDQKCNVTGDCTGDRTLCYKQKKGDSVFRGCASKSFCVDPPSIVDSHALFINCCEEDLCNSSSRSSAGVLLLTALITLFFFSK